MNRYAFYFVIALLAFGIGVSFAYFYFWYPVQVSEEISEQVEGKTPQINILPAEFSNRRTFSLTNKESALLFYKSTIDKWLKAEKIEKIVSSPPEVIETIKELKLSFNEEQFLINSVQKSYKPNLIDVNGDGEDELMIVDNVDSYTISDLWLLKRTTDDFKVILFDYQFIEKLKLLKNKSKKYFDIEASSGYSEDSDSSRKDIYKFNGKEYFHDGCFSYKYRYQDKNGKWHNLKKPILKKLDDCC